MFAVKPFHREHGNEFKFISLYFKAQRKQQQLQIWHGN